MLKDSRQREKKKKKKEREKKYGSEEEYEEEDPGSSRGSISEEDDEVVHRSKKARRTAVNSDSDSDLEADDVDKVMYRLPDNPIPLLDFANASQGILLLLVLKQHLKNLYGFSDRYPSYSNLTLTTTTTNIAPFFRIFCLKPMLLFSTAKSRNTHLQSPQKCTTKR